MKERLLGLIGHENGKTVFVSTFHGFCLDVLRSDGHYLDLPDPFSLCSETDTLVLAKEAVSEAGHGKSQRNTVRRFLKNLSDLKLHSVLKLRPVSNKASDPALDDLFSVFTGYQEKLRNFGMLDLDDLEVETLRLFHQHPDVRRKYALKFPHIFVDEYQDTNPVQVELLKRMVYSGTSESENTRRSRSESAPCVDICAIGDPNQAIYGFRGADISNFHGFANDFPGTTITLTKNYRSTQNILDLSALLINEERPLHGTSGPGAPVYLAQCRTHLEEAEMIIEQIEKSIGGTTYFSLDSERVASHEDGENIGFGDIAVLFRLNAMGDALEEAFLRAGIPFVRSGEKPLIEQYPANVIWRLLQTLSQPESDYYRTCYLNLLKPENDGDRIMNRLNRQAALGDVIDQAVELHGFDLDSEEISRTLDRVGKVAENCNHHLPSFLDALSLDRGIDLQNLMGDRVSLMSLHAAKGLEWQVVFIIGCEDHLLPCTLFGDRDDQEERRLLYVGLTRARQRLILSHASRRALNGRPLDMKISPFLEPFSSKQLVPLARSKWKRKPKAHEQLSLILMGFAFVFTPDLGLRMHLGRRLDFRANFCAHVLFGKVKFVASL